MTALQSPDYMLSEMSNAASEMSDTCSEVSDMTFGMSDSWDMDGTRRRFMLTMPAFQIPPAFTDGQFERACSNMRSEMIANNSFGKIPKYRYHPAYDLVVALTDKLCDRGIDPIYFAEADDVSHYMEEHDYRDESRNCILDVLNYLERTHQRGSRRRIAASIVPAAAAEPLEPIRLESGPVAYAKAPFSADTLYQVGLEFVEEMRSSNSRYTDPVPRYSHHPAYDVLVSHLEQLYAQGIHPMHFLTSVAGLNRRDKLLWYIECWVKAKQEPFFNYAQLEDPFSRLPPGDTSYLDFFPEVFSDEDDDDYDTGDTGVTLDQASACVNSLEQYNLSSDSNSDTNCPICMEQYVEFDTAASHNFDHVAVKTPCCRQPFGKDCLLEVLLRCGHTCPMCRQNIVELALAPVLARHAVDCPPLASA